MTFSIPTGMSFSCAAPLRLHNGRSMAHFDSTSRSNPVDASSAIRARRLEILETHFKSEVAHDWQTCLDTFAGQARYEIMATGQIHDGNAEVLAYHRAQRVAFPDQRHENVRIHVADDDTIIAEFELLGTNTGEFYGQPPTGKSFRVPVLAVFHFDGERIANERVYLDSASMIRQIGQSALLPLAGTAVSLLDVGDGE
jgi:steroid delta-isomerase-like uncharacterized protein